MSASNNDTRVLLVQRRMFNPEKDVALLDPREATEGQRSRFSAHHRRALATASPMGPELRGFRAAGVARPTSSKTRAGHLKEVTMGGD